MSAAISDYLHELPADMDAVLNSTTSLQEHWQSLPKLSQNEWICWVITCTKQETREKHLLRMVEDMNKGKKRPCCWPGCPHRRASAEKYFSRGALMAAKRQMEKM